MSEGGIKIKIDDKNLDLFRAAFRQAPQKIGPILGKGVSALTQAIFKQANRRNVPWDTGTLAKTFQTKVQGLTGNVYPTVKYADAVHDGYGPNVIKAAPGKALFWPGAAHPVKSVKHPGYEGDPFLDRMVKAAEPDTNRIQQKIADNVVNALSKF